MVVGAIIVGAMSVGEMIVGTMIVGTVIVGAMRRPRIFYIRKAILLCQYKNNITIEFHTRFCTTNK